MNAALQWSPLVSQNALLALAAFGAIVLLIARLKGAREFYGRGIFLLLFAGLLLGPFLVREAREALPDKLVIVVDESPSESIARRDEAAAKILASLEEKLKTMPGIEPVVIRAGRDAASVKSQNTALFAALQDNLGSIPLAQTAGTIIITDGQVHDAPQDIAPWKKLAPFNVILTGERDESDRKVTVTEAPKYGLLSQEVTIKVRVDDIGKPAGAPATLYISQDGGPAERQAVTAGEEHSFTFKLPHPGQNVFSFSVPAEEGELSAANNTAAVIVNGVRDRLKVLLVSGRPHIGERAWRDLLKSDPSIDLVHFTILRSPTSFDPTPPQEMALIAFPVEELFEKKINDFDLIIFDKYAQHGLLHPRYFDNIAAFVKGGGAFLMAMGSDAPEQSLFETALADILPVTPKPPEQSLLSGTYTPVLTEAGKAHPVTGDLKDGKWGSWVTQADVNAPRGQVLMTGLEGRPLLVLDKITSGADEGRVAALASDNIWMWSKGIQGGGPYTELLRHVAHWLMKEPELEEDFIKAEVRGRLITVSARKASPVTLTRPDGKDETLSLEPGQDGWAQAKVAAAQDGIHRFTNGAKTAFAIVGTAVSEEFSDIHTTPEKLAPLAEKTGGTVIWYSDTKDFSFTEENSIQGKLAGKEFIRIKKNAAYAVKNIESAALIPSWLFLLISLGGLMLIWWIEGRKK
jgi:hypothetical protein